MANSLGGEKKFAIGKFRVVANEEISVQREQIVGPSCKRPEYIEIEESSQSEDQKISKQYHG